MKKIKMILAVSITLFMVFGVMSGASALTITPETTPQWTGNVISNLDADDIELIVGFSELFELYKQDQGGASDSGLYASSYETAFLNTPGDPKDAVITYISGPYISASPLYIYVKDGNAEPAYYIFALNVADGLSWNGTDAIELNNFWPNQGAISHVTILGPKAVPEPATLLLLGLGLVGLAGLRRKF